MTNSTSRLIAAAVVLPIAFSTAGCLRPGNGFSPIQGAALGGAAGGIIGAVAGQKIEDRTVR